MGAQPQRARTVRLDTGVPQSWTRDGALWTRTHGLEWVNERLERPVTLTSRFASQHAVGLTRRREATRTGDGRVQRAAACASTRGRFAGREPQTREPTEWAGGEVGAMHRRGEGRAPRNERRTRHPPAHRGKEPAPEPSRVRRKPDGSPKQCGRSVRPLPQVVIPNKPPEPELRIDNAADAVLSRLGAAPPSPSGSIPFTRDENGEE